MLAGQLNNTANKRTWNNYSPCEACLINPPWITSKENMWHGIKSSMPPLGILSIASYIEKHGIDTAVIDIDTENLSTQQLKERLLKLNPKIIGISVTTSTAIQSNLLAKIIKGACPSSIVVMGGVHAETLPEESLRNKAVDVVVRGDGEITFYKLCESILNKEPFYELPGISFRNTDKNSLSVINNVDAKPIKDLNELPMPAYHLVPMHLYRPAIGAYRRLPAISMLTARGCIGHCSFCNSASKYPRLRKPETVVEEIIKLQQQYGIKEIQFYDDTFTVSKKNVLRFCELLQKNRINISWVAFARVDCFDKELAIAMKKAGCHQAMFGVESANSEVLNKMNKPMKLEDVRRSIGAAREAGLETRCAFIYGCEGETLSSMQETLDFALSLNIDLASFNIATPYPGTQLHIWAKENGYLKHENWKKYELGQPIIDLPTVSGDEIVKFYEKSHRLFYGRPKIMWSKLKKAKSIYHWLDLFKGFCFIMLKRNTGPRGNANEEWIKYNKEDFFDYNFN